MGEAGAGVTALSRSDGLSAACTYQCLHERSETVERAQAAGLFAAASRLQPQRAPGASTAARRRPSASSTATAEKPLRRTPRLSFCGYPEGGGTGMATSIRVPRPGGLSISIVPPSASTRSLRPISPVP